MMLKLKVQKFNICNDTSLLFGITNAHSGKSSLLPAKEKTPIKVTLRDGKVVDGLAWKTTPYEIARSIRYRCYV